MSSYPLLSVNMQRHNAAMHSLLETNKSDNILFVQEPWFDQVGVQRVDNARTGVDVLGGVAHPDWDLFYPFFTNNKWAKVITYRRKQINGRLNPLRVVPRLDLVQHNTILITDIYIGNNLLRAINYYNDVADSSSFASLTSLELDPTVPTILVGDFNIHSRTWSPEGWTRSPNTPPLEQWAANQTLSLHSHPREITRKGMDAERPSKLDLTWHNKATESLLSLTPPIIDWSASLGSNHAGVRTEWVTSDYVRRDKRPYLNTFRNALDHEDKV